MDNDVYFMNKALDMAKSGIGKTGSNPSVGCIIVKDDKIISSARTEDGGRPHAESLAINKLHDKELAKSTIYITLEPCCNDKENDVSCVKKIIQSKFSRVVIGTIDPNPKISGTSIEILKNNKIETTVGILKNECEEIIKGFKKRMLQNRPYITLKIATSLDGKIALANGKSKWITSEKLRKLSHQLRSKNDAILTGIGTVIADNPLLTCRLYNEQHSPIRIILDSDLRISKNSQIVQTANRIRTIIFTSQNSKNIDDDIKVITVKKSDIGLNLNDVLNHIANLGINYLLIEGGQKINTSFIKENLIDKIILFQSNKFIGGDGLNAIGNLNLQDLNQCFEFETEVIREN
jgi:diaminohydroxyphosphoribosylaminopyrimidine deaminase/5-amino-6-(5-phosphoribosylamino)uracil reductase